MSKEETANTKIEDKINDMLENTLEAPKYAYNTSGADYGRFVHSKIYELTRRPWYCIGRDETDKEGEKYVDEYIDLMVSYYNDNFRHLLLRLCFPVIFYKNERGLKILEQKYADN